MLYQLLDAAKFIVFCIAAAAILVALGYTGHQCMKGDENSCNLIELLGDD